MFWKVWIPAGIHEFFPKHHKDGTSLLSPSGFDAGIEHLRSVWKAGLPVECDVLYGVAITRDFRLGQLDTHSMPRWHLRTCSLVNVTTLALCTLLELVGAHLL
tara:strand:- start:20283 stop:20591 length:309 start_codon:yes stop_codon:yes gene_type:complete